MLGGATLCRPKAFRPSCLAFDNLRRRLLLPLRPFFFEPCLRLRPPSCSEGPSSKDSEDEEGSDDEGLGDNDSGVDESEDLSEDPEEMDSARFFGLRTILIAESLELELSKLSLSGSVPLWFPLARGPDGLLALNIRPWGMLFLFHLKVTEVGVAFRAFLETV